MRHSKVWINARTRVKALGGAEVLPGSFVPLCHARCGGQEEATPAHWQEHFRVNKEISNSDCKRLEILLWLIQGNPFNRKPQE